MNIRNSTSPIDLHSVIPMEILESDMTYFDSYNYEVGIRKLFVYRIIIFIDSHLGGIYILFFIEMHYFAFKIFTRNKLIPVY